MAIRENRAHTEFASGILQCLGWIFRTKRGIEGTISQGVRGMDVRHARYIGLARTHLQHVATAAAINVVRVVDWLMGERPEPTRRSPLLAFAT